MSVHLLHFCSQHLLLHSCPDPSGLGATNKVRERFPSLPHLLRIFPPESGKSLFGKFSLSSPTIIDEERHRKFPVRYHRPKLGRQTGHFSRSRTVGRNGFSRARALVDSAAVVVAVGHQLIPEGEVTAEVLPDWKEELE